ncbi:MAG: NAD-dependent epimerase/dehydratase family protein [Rubrobacteraceae bacterium]
MPKTVKVLLTGATGLLGGELLDLLTARGYEIRCLVRPESTGLTRLDPERVEISYGDAGEEESLSRSLSGVELCVHVAGIEYAPQVASAMQRVGVKRLLVVSSTSVYSAYEHCSGWRRKVESLVRESGLEWTIVRPSMIYGSELDKNMHKLLRFLDRSPIYPMFGPGTNLWQPVYYEDLADGILETLKNDQAVYQSYDLPGAEPLTYREIVQVSAGALGREPYVIRLPIEPVRHVLQLAERVRLPLPIESEQVMRLREDKAYPYEKARQDLGYAPRSFRDGIKSEVSRLRKIGLVKDWA